MTDAGCKEADVPHQIHVTFNQIHNLAHTAEEIAERVSLFRFELIGGGVVTLRDAKTPGPVNNPSVAYSLQDSADRTSEALQRIGQDVELLSVSLNGDQPQQAVLPTTGIAASVSSLGSIGHP